MKRPASIRLVAALLLLAATSCTDHNDTPSMPEGYISDNLPTTDVIKETVSGAYLKYGNPENDNLAKAVMERHTLGNAAANGTNIKSVFIDMAALASMKTADYENIVSCIMTDKALLVVNPTVENWNKFAHNAAAAYVNMTENDRLPDNCNDGGKNFLNGLVRDIRLERTGDIYGLPIVKNDNAGLKDVFSSILAIRGNSIRSYDNDISQNPDSMTSVTFKYNNNGNLISSDTDGKAQAVMPECEANDYSVGLMADNIAERIEKDDDNGNAAKATADVAEAGDLKSIMEAQEFSHVFRADNFASSAIYYKHRSCLVETKYYIWAVYAFNKDTDYYIVHQVITSHNGNLGCTAGTQEWDRVYGDNVYLGAWAGDMANSINLLDEQGN